jgi:hypothetical protein
MTKTNPTRTARFRQGLRAFQLRIKSAAHPARAILIKRISCDFRTLFDWA